MKSIWIVGSSIIRHAFVHARNSYSGTQLDLKRHYGSVLWQGSSGLKWESLVPKIKLLLSLESQVPDYIVIHCGGNNIGGKKKSIVLRKQMEKTIISLHKHLPNTKLVWSQILPRRKYRSKIPTFELDEVRKRINNRLATVVLRTGGNYIRYPELSLKNRDFFEDDGVHLSLLGNDVFLYRIQQAFQTFLTSEIKVSPTPGDVGPWLALI